MATAQGSTQHHIYDKLEHEIQLKNLVNPESLGNVVRQFGEFHKVRLTVVELDGSVLCGDDARPCFCRLRHLDETDDACKACSAEIPLFETSTEKFASLTCLSQVQYARARIDNQFEPAGHIILGPFAEKRPQVANGDLSDEDRTRLEQAVAELPMLTLDRATDIARLMCIVVEELVFANYQSYLFSKMHLQLSNENVGEVTDQKEDESFNQMLDSSEFSSLF